MPPKARLITLNNFSIERGYCRTAALPYDAIGDLLGTARSGCRLFEDGVEIGPARSFHDDIRQLGGGRFSHWEQYIYFSSSDGAPPECNGRSYQALIPAGEAGPNALLALLATSDFSITSTDQRYAVLEELLALLIPGVHLPEFERSMFCDKEFRRDYERFSVTNYRSYDRKFAMREFTRLVLHIDGQFAECGVFEGASAYILAKELQVNQSHKKLHLYDSFEGLSSPASIDGTHWTKGAMLGRLDDVKDNLQDLADYLIYHKGWIPDCFDRQSSDAFSFVHIDVDLHQPTLDALEYFYPRMSRHGIIIGDDYGFNTCPGARKAFDDFFADKREVVLHLPTAQGVVIFDS
jgi:O-methyltransferase